MATKDKLVTLEDLNELKKYNDSEVSELKSEIDYIGETGNIAVSHDITWQNGYVGTTGLINSSSLSGFALVQLQEGETVSIGTKNTNIAIISTTTSDSVNVGDTVHPVKITTNVDTFQTYEYTATSPINVVLCVRLSNYSVSFYKKSNLVTESEIENIEIAVDNINYVEKTITDGSYIDSTNGSAVQIASFGYATFNVEGLDGETATIATKLYSGSAAGWVVLLKDGTISVSGTTENATITLPENVDVVKISCFKNALSPENIKLNCNYSKQLALKKEIPNVEPLIEQLYDTKTVLYSTGKEVWDKGILNANGGVTLTAAWRTCDFVEISSDSTLTYKLSMYTGVYYIAFYDANQQYISNSAIQSTVTNNWKNKYTTGTAVIPTGAKYVRFSFRADNDSLYNEQSITVDFARITSLEDDVLRLENKEKITARVLIIGDSYSANTDKWIAPMMEEFADDSSYISLAVSSATVKDQSNDRTTYPYTSRPLSSNTTPNTNTFGCQIAKLKRLIAGTDLDSGETAIYQSESDYPNIIIIQGGENDWKDSNTNDYIAQYEVAVENVYYSRWGTISQGTAYIKPDVNTVDRTIFAGAYRYLMDELYELFPNAQYFFTTTSPIAPHQNSVVALRRDVAEQQKFCANLNCVSVIDWYGESQMSIIVNSVSSGDGTQANPYVVTPATQDSTDGLHPTEYGGKKLGKLAAHIINSRFMILY